MSWIKIDSTLADKPQVRKMARMLKLDRRFVAGGLVTLWGWCDLHSVDGTTMLLPDEVDALCGKKGFAEAMLAVGWLVNDGEEVLIADFEKHNGASAKKRAQDARRQENKRNRGSVTQESPNNHAPSVTERGQEREGERYLDKRREDKENTLLSESAKESPDAPALRRQRSYLRPADSSEVATAMAADPTIGLNRQELMDCAARFLDKYEANGWIDRDGHTIENWIAAARGYARSWKANLRADSGRRGSRGGSNTTNRQQDCNDPSRYQ